MESFFQESLTFASNTLKWSNQLNSQMVEYFEKIDEEKRSSLFPHSIKDDTI